MTILDLIFLIIGILALGLFIYILKLKESFQEREEKEVDNCYENNCNENFSVVEKQSIKREAILEVIDNCEGEIYNYKFKIATNLSNVECSEPRNYTDWIPTFDSYTKVNGFEWKLIKNGMIYFEGYEEKHDKAFTEMINTAKENNNLELVKIKLHLENEDYFRKYLIEKEKLSKIKEDLNNNKSFIEIDIMGKDDKINISKDKIISWYIKKGNNEN
jgi:hypothetical protein